MTEFLESVPVWAKVIWDIVYPAVIAIGTCAVFYRQYFQKTRLSISIGDSIWFVQSMQGSARKVQLVCTFLNQALHDAVVQRMEADFISSTGQRHRFNWHIFYKWADGGVGTEKTSDALPVPVPATSSHREMIQFLADPMESISWQSGAYAVTIHAWVNAAQRTDEPTVSQTFRVYLSQSVADFFNTASLTGPQVIKTRTLDWLPSEERERILRGERIENEEA